MSTSGKGSEELTDDVKETTRYWKLEEEGPDRTVWRTGFGKEYGCVVRQTTELTFWHRSFTFKF